MDLLWNTFWGTREEIYIFSRGSFGVRDDAGPMPLNSVSNEKSLNRIGGVVFGKGKAEMIVFIVALGHRDGRFRAFYGESSGRQTQTLTRSL